MTSKLYDEEASLESFHGVGCFVRTYKNENKLEIEFTEHAKKWLTNQTLCKHDGAIMTIGQRNIYYLQSKLDEFINSAMKNNDK